MLHYHIGTKRTLLRRTIKLRSGESFDHLVRHNRLTNITEGEINVAGKGKVDRGRHVYGWQMIGMKVVAINTLK